MLANSSSNTINSQILLAGQSYRNFIQTVHSPFTRIAYKNSLSLYLRFQDTAFWCRNCSVEFNPEEENVRRESKLSVPNRNIEPAVSTTPGIPDISIRHEPEIKGGLNELQKKGLKITHYEERKG